MSESGDGLLSRWEKTRLSFSLKRAASWTISISWRAIIKACSHASMLAPDYSAHGLTSMSQLIRLAIFRRWVDGRVLLP